MIYTTDTRKHATHRSRMWVLAAMAVAACTNGDMLVDPASPDTSGPFLAPGVHASLLTGSHAAGQQTVQLILDGRDIDFASYQGFIELNDLGMRLLSVAVPDTDTHIFNLEAASTGLPIVGLAANGFDEPVSITLNVSTPRALRAGDIAVHFNVVANRAGADISPTQFFGATELGEATYAIEEGTAEVMADPDPIFRAERSTISPADPIPSLNIINIAIGDSARLILAPNDSITLDVNVDMANVDTLDLASLQFDMGWDPEAIIYQSFTPGPFGEVSANDEDTRDNGQFSANIVSSNGSRSSFTAMSLNFVAGAAGATVPRLRIESAGNEDGVDIQARMVPRTISICVDAGGLLGDVNGAQLPATTPGAEPDTTAVATAGVTDVIDTQQIARWLVDLEVPVRSRMRTHGDVNGDFKTNIVDAQQIARYSVRLPVDYFIGEEIELDCKYPLSVLTPSQKLPDALVAKEYEFQFESAGGAGDIEWHAPENWGGPEGMWIENETGILSGEPMKGEEGSHTFSIRVEQDAEDWARYQEAFKSFTIDVLPQTEIVLDTLVFTEVAASSEFEQGYWIAPMGLVDSIYNVPLTAIGGGGDYTWEVLDWGRALPEGLEIVTDSAAGTSSITGTPTFTGFDLEVYLRAISKLGSSSEPTRIDMTISGPLVNEIKELWPSIIGEEYAKDLWDDEYREEYGTLIAQGGDGVYTWSITAGALPDGLSMVLDTLDGYEPRSDPRNFRTRIRGIPTTAATDTITIRLDSGDGRSVSTEYILKTQRRAKKIEIQLASDTLVTTRTEWVELNMSSLGDTLLLLARISDGTDFRMEDAPVTWFSADTAVVTVDSLGQVVSVGEGWVKVTATSGANADDPLADGAVRPDDYEDPLAASLYINVGVVAASVTLSDSLLTLSSFQDSIKISGVIKDSLGTVISLNNRNMWFYTDNGGVAYTDDVLGRGANPLVAGEAWVIASFENGTTTIYGVTNSPEGDVVGSMKVIVQQLPVKLVMSYSLPSDPNRWLAFPSDSVMDFSSYGGTSTLSVIKHEDESLRPRDARGYEIQEDGLAVTWSSSDSTVAKVDDAGTVTSVGDGSATIKVEIGSVFVTVDVTVGQRPSQVEMSGADVVSIEETSDLEAYKQLSFPGRSGTSQLVGTVKDQAGSVMSESTIVWSSSDTTIATVSSTGLVSAVGFGPATVKATVYDVDDSSKALAVGEVTAAVSFKWTSVSAGEEHSTGITTDGKIWGWGGNFSKQAGGGSEGNIRTPKKFNTDLTWTSLSAGLESNAGVSSAGDAYVWGQRDGMGNGGFTDSSTPVLVSGGLVWASVSVGSRHTVGLTTDGKAYSWGQNYDGKLGSWTAAIVEKSSDPVLVAGGHTWASVVAGADHTLGLTTAGEAYAWGRNEYGGLGNGTVDSTHDGDPVLVLGGHTWAQVAGGGAMSAGVTTDGDLYTWGWNRYGQLGDGTTDNRVTPVLVTGGREFSSVSVGGYYMVGITTDGDAYAWGRSIGGNLGDGEDRNRGEPVLVIGNHTWSSVTTGWYHTMGVTTDGDVYVWGNNAQGQLGDGTTQWNPTPTLLVPRIIG